MQPDELSYFDSSDFLTMWPAFKSGVEAKTIEYRDVYKYTEAYGTDNAKDSRIKYEDNLSVGKTRYTDAKKQSAYMLKASLLTTGYTATWFTAPKYGTELEKAMEYLD